VTGHRVAVDGQHSVIDIVGPGRCSECIEFPCAVYIQYTCPTHPFRNEPVDCGLHFYGENDPHMEGRRIVKVIFDS
jgi:hypothetical protein